MSSIALVCLSVTTITQKVMNGIGLKFYGGVRGGHRMVIRILTWVIKIHDYFFESL